MSILQEIIKEMAITSGGSIAANPSGGGEMRRRDVQDSRSRPEWTDSAKADHAARREAGSKMYVDPKSKQSLDSARAKLKKKKSIKSKIKRFFGLGEAVDLDDVSSRFKDMQTGATEDDTVTYGVEDDQGNLMKITVKSDIAKDFEDRLSQEIQKNAEFESDINKIPNRNTPSMAEVLFKLKDEFEIIDVEFPTIPKNTVYKAAGVDMREPESGVGQTDLENDLGYEDDDFSMDGEGGADGEMGGMGGGMEGGDEFGDATDGEDEFGLGGGEDDLASPDGDMGGEDGMTPPGEDDFSDDESVEDFSSSGATSGGTEGLLNAILQMLQADAEAKKAQAEAETEKAKALQAEYSAKAASASIAQQTELIAMEQDIAKQKEKEKEARKLADLAKFQVKKSNSFTSEAVNANAAVDRILLELDDSAQSVMAIRRIINTAYRILPTDDEITKKMKIANRRNAMQEYMAKQRGVKVKDTFNLEKAKQEQDLQAREAALKNGQQPNGQQSNGQQINGQQPNGQQQQRPRSNVAPPPSSVGSGRLGSMR